MAITCAFYGFVNRTTKVTLAMDPEQLQVGHSMVYEGGNYVILSVFEADGHFHANVGLEQLHHARMPSRLKSIPPHRSALANHQVPDNQRDVQASALRTRLMRAEATLQDLLREREEVLKRLEDAIQQLDRIHQNARM